MCVKALQDRCVAKEGVVTRVRKHNTNLMNEQGQYKDAVCTLNKELKEVREKLEEADCQKEKLQQEVTDLAKGWRQLVLTPSEILKHRNRSLTLVLSIMALGLMIALNKLRRHS